MKTIVIPTNARAGCISSLVKVLPVISYDRIKCIFLQVRPLPDDLTGLLMLSRERGQYDFFDDSFVSSAKQLQKKYRNRLTIDIDYIYGDSPAVFRNYLEHQKCDLVVYDRSEWSGHRNSSRLDIFQMVRRCRRELIYVPESRQSFIGDRSPSSHEAELLVNAPSSVIFQYKVVENLLNGIQVPNAGTKIVSKKVGNLTRYFMNENRLDKMLHETGSSMLLLKS